MHEKITELRTLRTAACFKTDIHVKTVTEVVLMNGWRIKGFRVLCIVLLSVLAGRLIQVQVISTESFSKHKINLLEASVKQRSQVLKIDDGRGEFYDRHGNPLAHEEIPTLVLFPFLKRMNWPAEKVAEIIGVSKQDILSATEKAKEPFVYGGKKNPILLSELQSDQINKLKIPGVFAVRKKFTDNKTPSAQLIGWTTKDEKTKARLYPDKSLPPEVPIGTSGLQKSFDEFLLSEGEAKLVYHVDGTGGPLFGADVKYVEPGNPLSPIKIITTLDKDMQSAAERLVAKHGIKQGGLLLIDIDTSEIRALVSVPGVNKSNPNDIGNKNLMFERDTPGSIFKTVTAAAAIDEGIIKPSRTFNCDLTIDGKPDEQHEYGPLNFEQSFARSCNRTFAELGQEMADKNPDFLERYADKLGLTGQSGWQGRIFHIDPFVQLDKEDKGVIWHDDQLKQDRRMIAKTAIGQQDVQITPLAIANMMATIARGGQAKMVKAVQKIEFNNGTTVFEFPDKRLHRENALSPYTAMKLQQLLRKVVTQPNGTGASLSGLPYEVAGKSGTAQTNMRKKQLNKWFAGYFPYKEPKYALVTVNLNTDGQSQGITSLFSDMVQELYKIDQTKFDN
ncbi:peptidoglycan D,D-transpeptidase FtsI family protein [Peribacillus sp. SCS-155]|uniref:peptidoglycan D,D-transpeptidase FtsI family protein n=1 Tax=Peribacillus sedimenti TaxID=3115297 RepID=UPI0039061081